MAKKKKQQVQQSKWEDPEPEPVLSRAKTPDPVFEPIPDPEIVIVPPSASAKSPLGETFVITDTGVPLSSSVVQPAFQMPIPETVIPPPTPKKDAPKKRSARDPSPVRRAASPAFMSPQPPLLSMPEAESYEMTSHDPLLTPASGVHHLLDPLTTPPEPSRAPSPSFPFPYPTSPRPSVQQILQNPPPIVHVVSPRQSARSGSQGKGKAKEGSSGYVSPLWSKNFLSRLVY